MAKRLGYFFKATTSALLVFFVLVKSYSISFLASFKVSTDHLFDNLESGKRNYCFGKKVCKKS